MSIGAFIEGIADGGMAMHSFKQDKQLVDALSQGRDLPPEVMGTAGAVGDPMDTSIPDYGRAFLNAVALGESGGKYDVRYTPEGGATFDVSAGHPGIFEKGPHGPSSAAGRYQHTLTTWRDQGGGQDFSPKMQDRMAWQLAQDRYKTVTGGDLSAALQANGMTEDVTKALAPTWVSFEGPGGSKARAEYDASISRYRTPPSTSGEPRSVIPERDTLMSRILKSKGLLG